MYACEPAITVSRNIHLLVLSKGGDSRNVDPLFDSNILYSPGFRLAVPVVRIEPGNCQGLFVHEKSLQWPDFDKCPPYPNVLLSI